MTARAEAPAGPGAIGIAIAANGGGDCGGLPRPTPNVMGLIESVVAE